MKKPLTLVPPAQAEALYDETLRETRRGVLSVAMARKPSSPQWDAREWDEEDLAEPTKRFQLSLGRTVSNAHERPSSSKSSR
jgi:hypothetical protein